MKRPRVHDSVSFCAKYIAMFRFMVDDGGHVGFCHHLCTRKLNKFFQTFMLYNNAKSPFIKHYEKSQYQYLLHNTIN